jgi:Mg2+/citrate symporter
MANEVTAVTALAEPLTQYGIVGVIFAYVIFSDWLARKERTRIEASRAQQDSEREKDCVKRIRELEDRQLKFMQTVSASTNAVLSDLTRELRKHGLKVSLPTNIEDGTQDETRIIKRKDIRHD